MICPDCGSVCYGDTCEMCDKKVGNGIPDEEMFLQFSSGINVSKSQNGLPATMEIDWIKCYKKISE